MSRPPFSTRPQRPATPWFPAGDPIDNPRLRLFCVAHAGGNAELFRGWQHELPAGVEVCAVELPGRARHRARPPYTDLIQLVDDLAGEVRPLLDAPVAIYGHSLGALVGFELAHRVSGAGATLRHLFVSGCPAPHLLHLRPTLYDLPDGDLVARLREMNGTPAEVLDNPALLEIVLPLLRADFSVIDTYAPGSKPPLACPITAIAGLDDREVTGPELRAWAQHTSAGCELRMLPGDHFIVVTERALLLRLLARDLAPIVDQPAGV